MATKEHILVVKKKFQAELMKKMNVNGVGIGFKQTGGKFTDELNLVVLVTRKIDPARLASKDLIPANIDNVRTDVKEVGRIVIHKSRSDRWRPAPPGVSVGHYAITAGTFGAVVFDNATNTRLILSNNHVLANSNNAVNGDNILQPGYVDSGRSPQDRIADLKRFVPITFEKSDDTTCSIANGVATIANFIARMLGSKSRLTAFRSDPVPNEVDAAVATPWGDSVKDEILEIGFVSELTEPALDMMVKKSGRTTGLTKGRITTLNAMVQVGYGDGKTAIFENQIITSDMSAPGDSGSLLVEDESNKAVGLLFAGSEEITVHCPIKRVVELLDIHFG